MEKKNMNRCLLPKILLIVTFLFFSSCANNKILDREIIGSYGGGGGPLFNQGYTLEFKEDNTYQWTHYNIDDSNDTGDWGEYVFGEWKLENNMIHLVPKSARRWEKNPKQGSIETFDWDLEQAHVREGDLNIVVFKGSVYLGVDSVYKLKYCLMKNNPFKSCYGYKKL